MSISIAKSEIEVIESHLEVLVRLLLSRLIHIGNSFLQMYTEFDYEHGTRRRKLFLDCAMKTIKRFFNSY